MQANTADRTGQQSRTAHPPLSRLWQVPTFFLGLAAAVLVVWHQPVWRGTPADRAAAALKDAAAALERGDVDAAIELAQEAVDLTAHSPRLAGEANFVLGSACLLQAERASGNESAGSYQRARACFEKAQELHISADSESRLAFRLIKTKLQTGVDSTELIPALEKTLEAHAADRVEGYTLLTGLFLAKSPPDLEGALRANEKLLSQATLTEPNPVRLQRGELLWKLKRREEARTVLARIAPGAHEFSAARHMRAIMLFEDEQWQEAADIWEQALRDRTPDLQQVRQSQYFLGICLARLGRARDALHVWQQLQATASESDEAIAAAFQRAETCHVAGQEDQALSAFANGLQVINSEKNNPYLDLPAMRRMVEEAWQRWFTAGELDRARELARHYRRIDPPGEADWRLGQASQAAGLVKLRQAELAAGPGAEDLILKARQLFLDAGEAFTFAAHAHETRADYPEHLWAAAENLLRAQEYRRALPLLDKCLTLRLSEARQTEALLGVAEAHQALGQTEQAVNLLTEVLVRSGPLQGKARFLLALTFIDRGKLAEERGKHAEIAGQYAEAQTKSAEAQNHYAAAEAALREILAMPARDPEPAELRQAHFALAYVHYQRRQFGEAAKAYEEALAHYPTHPQSMQARYWLGESYREIAREDANRLRSTDTGGARKYYEERKCSALERALANYRQVAFDLAARQTARQLKEDQESALRDARFAMGECLCSLQRYQEAADVYEKLAENYANQADGIEALLNLAECHRYLGSMDGLKRAVERCRAMLAQLDAKELQPPHPTRAQWLESIERVAKAAEKP
jgi:tetratricopeptide (TPR) repeat protein